DVNGLHRGRELLHDDLDSVRREVVGVENKLGHEGVARERTGGLAYHAGRLAGVGGFVNISQNARSLVFCGTFTTGGLEVAIENGSLRIVREGRVPKFVSSVHQRGFSATRARTDGQRVLYVTERAVFRLAEAGIELIEVAPGIDIQTQILNQMEFAPVIRAVAPMAPHLFRAPA
ncbi:MAG: hypothetical protein EBS30_13490, partial [Planctomycetes bacterium]|nr:hypothetical protein [Planctomycetota bacterium]